MEAKYQLQTDDCLINVVLRLYFKCIYYCLELCNIVALHNFSHAFHCELAKLLVCSRIQQANEQLILHVFLKVQCMHALAVIHFSFVLLFLVIGRHLLDFNLGSALPAISTLCITAKHNLYK